MKKSVGLEEADLIVRTEENCFLFLGAGLFIKIKSLLKDIDRQNSQVIYEHILQDVRGYYYKLVENVPTDSDDYYASITDYPTYSEGSVELSTVVKSYGPVYF